MNTEITIRSVPLVRSGHSEERGELTIGALCMIPSHSFSRNACVYYKNTIVGCVRNLTFVDMQNGVAELRGDIVLDCSYGAIAEAAFDEVYPVASLFSTYDAKYITDLYLNSISLSSKDEREFEDQQPLDLSDLRNLVNSIKKSEAPESATLFNKKCDNANSGLIGHISCNEENKIYLNETDTLEAKDGYLIVDAGRTKEAIRIDTINRMYSVQNNDNSKSIFIYGHNGGTDIPRSTRLSIEDLIKFIEKYKESQLAELKAS